MRMIHLKAWTLAGAAALIALAPNAAKAQAPMARGLIVGSVESAIEQPVERMEKFSLVIDLSDRTLFVMSGDDVVRTFPVSVGTSNYPTPNGAFSIRRIIWNPSWRPPPSAWARDDRPQPPGAISNPMGRVKIFFREPDYYIHGTFLPSSLGNARSHGCVRMRNIDVVELARMIMINAGSRQDQEWYRTTVANKETSREVNLPKAIPVRVRA
jgi:lipoprotein-anchoring transpeptidase ErfK/SrfK